MPLVPRASWISKYVLCLVRAILLPLRVLQEFVSQCDVVTANAPPYKGTHRMVNVELLHHFKKGAWLVNTARGAVCDKDEAVKSGQLNGYSGDVWNVPPTHSDHPWKTMKNLLDGGNGIVPHYSSTTLDAQIRYSNGVKQIIDNYLNGKPQDPTNESIGTRRRPVGE